MSSAGWTSASLRFSAEVFGCRSQQHNGRPEPVSCESLKGLFANARYRSPANARNFLWLRNVIGNKSQPGHHSLACRDCSTSHSRQTGRRRYFLAAMELVRARPNPRHRESKRDSRHAKADVTRRAIQLRGSIERLVPRHRAGRIWLLYHAQASTRLFFNLPAAFGGAR